MTTTPTEEAGKVSFWRRLFKPKCRHVYRGIDLPKRDDFGMVNWPCSLCGEVARVEHGLEVIKNGATITGPWGSKPAEDRRSVAQGGRSRWR